MNEPIVSVSTFPSPLIGSRQSAPTGSATEKHSKSHDSFGPVGLMRIGGSAPSLPALCAEGTPQKSLTSSNFCFAKAGASRSGLRSISLPLNRAWSHLRFDFFQGALGAAVSRGGELPYHHFFFAALRKSCGAGQLLRLEAVQCPCSNFWLRQKSESLATEYVT